MIFTPEFNSRISRAVSILLNSGIIISSGMISGVSLWQ